jgi:hypothetical protein
MGSSKTSKQTSTVELPPELRQASLDNLRLAQDVGRMPAIHNFGPTVAALTPQQDAAMMGTNQAASAFGLPNGGAIGSAAMPTVVDVGGARGYSTKGLYDNAMDQVPQFVKDLLSQFTHSPGAKVGAASAAPATVVAKSGRSSEERPYESSRDREVYTSPRRSPVTYKSGKASTSIRAR